MWVFLLFGLYGAISVSWQTITNTAPCPNVVSVPVCYVILTAYLVMAVAVLIRSLPHFQSIAFYSAWTLVFGVALLASILEASNGDTCPKSDGGFPMCYASLFISGMTALLFWYSNRQTSTKGD